MTPTIADKLTHSQTCGQIASRKGRCNIHDSRLETVQWHLLLQYSPDMLARNDVFMIVEQV